MKRKIYKDEVLEAAKRESQERSRELVRSGKRTPESMSWFSPETVKKLIIKHRWP